MPPGVPDSTAEREERRVAVLVAALEASDEPMRDRDIEEPRPASQRDADAESETMRRRHERARAILGAPPILPHLVPDDALDTWHLGRWMIITLSGFDDGAAVCEIDYTDDPMVVLMQLSCLMIETRGLMRVDDLDADGDAGRVGIRVRLSFASAPDIHYERDI